MRGSKSYCIQRRPGYNAEMQSLLVLARILRIYGYQSTLPFALLLLFASASGQPLDIYWIDVEGGAATLIVTPEGESVLFDTGWQRSDARDALRIQQVATQEAGLDQIDHLIITHFHRDHYGGTLSLSELLPVKNYYDRGPVTELREDPQFPQLYADYEKAHRGNRRTLNPGDEVPLRPGATPLRLRCIVSNRQVIDSPGPNNPACVSVQSAAEDPSDNAASIGVLLEFGDFRFLNLGDLTWNVEGRLVCPIDRIGPVDAYQVTHHGLSSSNNPVLLQTVRPTVAIINNGPRKGGSPEVLHLIKGIESIRDVFQVHRNVESELNVPAEMIANLGEEDGCAGEWIRLRVETDGSAFAVTNSRNGLSKNYISANR